MKLAEIKRPRVQQVYHVNVEIFLRENNENKEKRRASFVARLVDEIYVTLLVEILTRTSRAWRQAFQTKKLTEQR